MKVYKWQKNSQRIDSEFGTKCTLCGTEDKNNPLFAQIWILKINGLWHKLCKKCKTKQEKIIENINYKVKS